MVINQIVLKRFLSSKKFEKLPWTYELEDLKGDEIVETFYNKELGKTIQSHKSQMKEKKKCDKLHVKKKGYNSSFMTVQVITQNQIVIVEAK